MDYNLSSGVDTYEFGQFLRQNKIPFIVVSGYSPADIPAGYEPEVFLQKPVRPEEFETAVRSVFEAVKPSSFA